MRALSFVVVKRDTVPPLPATGQRGPSQTGHWVSNNSAEKQALIIERNRDRVQVSYRQEQPEKSPHREGDTKFK